MKGAREYAELFRSGQFGKLYLVCGENLRGRTFGIWVLPTNVPIACMPWEIQDAVEVYGATGDKDGWPETYGWLHHGRWEQDFAVLVSEHKARAVRMSEHRAIEKAAAEEAEKRKQVDLLAAY